jgi:hypothetical protein
MTEKILDTLHILKKIEPSEETLASIKATIDARIKQEAPTPSPYLPPRTRFIRTPYVRTVTTLLTFSFVIFFAQTSLSVEKALLSAKISLSPNAHTQSLIALDALEKASTMHADGMRDSKTYETIQYAINLSQNTLDTLQLMGENGKYTMEECLQDYRRYSAILETIEESLEKLPVPQTEAERERLQALILQVYNAGEEAEARLGKYPQK